MILAVPVFLYFLGFPRAGIENLDEKFGGKTMQQDQRRQALAMLTGGSAMTRVLRKTEPRTLNLKFKELTDIAARPSRHDAFEGDIGRIRGQFAPVGENEFTLFRVDRTCCVADQTYLQMRIEAPERLKINPETWVMVTGTISFRKNEKGNWVPVILVQDMNDIQVDVEPARNVTDF